jgi:hypothetical protein
MACEWEMLKEEDDFLKRNFLDLKERLILEREDLFIYEKGVCSF